MGFLESQVEKNPEDGELKAELLQLYIDEGIRDMAYELADEVMSDNPTGRLYRTVAKMRLDDGDTERQFDSTKSPSIWKAARRRLARVYFNIGIAHQQEGRLASAGRSSVAHSMQILRMSRRSLQSATCTRRRFRVADRLSGEDRAVYWLAADYFDRAASRAENDAYANQARQRRQQIQRFFPTAEDKFFKNWNPGDRYTINYGCYTWIGETTTVR